MGKPDDTQWLKAPTEGFGESYMAGRTPTPQTNQTGLQGLAEILGRYRGSADTNRALGTVGADKGYASAQRNEEIRTTAELEKVMAAMMQREGLQNGLLAEQLRAAQMQNQSGAGSSLQGGGAGGNGYGLPPRSPRSPQYDSGGKQWRDRDDSDDEGGDPYEDERQQAIRAALRFANFGGPGKF